MAAWAVLVLAAPYFAVPTFEGAKVTPFSGPHWHNPYQGFRARFLKVNLHAHSRAWLGLTAGANSPDELISAYAAAGYDAAAVSNYHQVTHLRGASLPTVRAYEHGLNFSKSHRLVLGVDHAMPFDFPVATRSGRQWVLNALGEPGALVALNHPSLREGHSCADVQALTGYQLIEVHNVYAVSLFEWDCALSAGRRVWAVGNDDAHGAREESIGVAWNMIGAADASEGRLLEALAAGRSYVVRGERGRMDVEVLALSLDGEGGVSLELSAVAERVDWIGDGGQLLQRDEGVSAARYVLQKRDRYVRAVVRTPITELVLNPVVRTRGVWVAPVASIDWPVTVGGWVLWVGGAGLLAWVSRRRPALRLIVSEKRPRAA